MEYDKQSQGDTNATPKDKIIPRLAYNRSYEGLGTLSQLAGLGVVIYGLLTTQDMAILGEL